MPGLLAGTDRLVTVDTAGGPLAEVAARLAPFGPVDVVVFDPRASGPDAFSWMLRTDATGPVATAAGRGHGLFPAGTACWYDVDVDEDPRFLDGDGTSAASAGLNRLPGMRKVTFHRRLPGHDLRAYRARYLEHRAIARIHHANASRYRQNLVTGYEGPDDHAADGVSEHWYRDLDEAINQHFARPDSPRVVRADVLEWLDVSTAIVGYGTNWACPPRHDGRNVGQANDH
jgi:hypothetical protein